ncbi:hypothetical protein [Streptomyces sp. SS]|uniref:hypothetical protein n=1 Tax=Streptomyces sp. SS TaxID=260742 RepID=UPI00031C23FF|nr:hypothetical protein [Streptomyces sp. SS]
MPSFVAPGFGGAVSVGVPALGEAVRLGGADVVAPGVAGLVALGPPEPFPWSEPSSDPWQAVDVSSAATTAAPAA